MRVDADYGVALGCLLRQNEDDTLQWVAYCTAWMAGIRTWPQNETTIRTIRNEHRIEVCRGFAFDGSSLDSHFISICTELSLFRLSHVSRTPDCVCLCLVSRSLQNPNEKNTFFCASRALAPALQNVDEANDFISRELIVSDASLCRCRVKIWKEKTKKAAEKRRKSANTKRGTRLLNSPAITIMIFNTILCLHLTQPRPNAKSQMRRSETAGPKNERRRKNKTRSFALNSCAAKRNRRSREIRKTKRPISQSLEIDMIWILCQMKSGTHTAQSTHNNAHTLNESTAVTVEH